MTYALVALAALLVASNVTQAIWLHGANSGKDAARDLAHATKEQLIQAHADLTDADQTIKAKTAEIEILKQRLEAAEKQRNDALGAARDHYVGLLNKTSTAESARLVAEMLATPIHGVLPQAGKRSDDPVDGLLDPDA